jgi:uncharacterized membrane protein
VAEELGGMTGKRYVEGAQWLMLGGMFALTAWAWLRVPNQVPVHWNLAGDVDRYGGKAEGLLLVPVLAVALYGLFLVLPRLDPAGANYARFRGAYDVIRLAIIGLLGVVQVVVVATALGVPLDVSRILMVATGALFALLGGVLGRVQPNWFVGIRTPWTLTSQRSWTATHRLGGRVFAVIGLATAVVGLVRPEWAFWIMMVGLGVGMTATIIYSYRVWRDDPDKAEPPGGRGRR